MNVDVPVVGLPLKRVAVILASATRPLTLLLQLGLRDIPVTAAPSPEATLLDVNLPNEEERVRTKGRNDPIADQLLRRCPYYVLPLLRLSLPVVRSVPQFAIHRLLTA